MGNDNVLLFVPNIIGYIRILLTLLAFAGYHHPTWFVVFYSASVILDGVDGYAARKLNQCSEFGAWLDVVVDLFSRGLLWCFLSQYGYVVMCVEWLTFVSTHCRGADWKIPEASFPWLVTRVMAKGFKTPWGAAAIGGVHLLPLWLYMYVSGFLGLLLFPPWFQLVGIAMLTGGRGLCLYVEVFYIYSHVVALLRKSSSQEAG
ncbi:CDP-diacylglycerol--inositol 3-phosphatidyltransferase-like [Babylonia areolata]|uniref:CDP-diacylglycerol--inositol 3-phosphatidyltransferase-like n=1 Tax=Babylonia areolata TaxID=304850 RepID=UPI003FD4C901